MNNITGIDSKGLEFAKYLATEKRDIFNTWDVEENNNYFDLIKDKDIAEKFNSLFCNNDKPTLMGFGLMVIEARNPLYNTARDSQGFMKIKK